MTNRLNRPLAASRPSASRPTLFYTSGIALLPHHHDPLLAVPRLMDVHQVAHRLGFGIEVVRDLIRSGELPAILLRGRWWRVDPRDLEAYIEAGRVAAKRQAERLRPPLPSRVSA